VLKPELAVGLADEPKVVRSSLVVTEALSDPFVCHVVEGATLIEICEELGMVLKLDRRALKRNNLVPQTLVTCICQVESLIL
jgi:hypothetical protein